jgi:hypothetical protein
MNKENIEQTHFAYLVQKKYYPLCDPGNQSVHLMRLSTLLNVTCEDCLKLMKKISSAAEKNEIFSKLCLQKPSKIQSNKIYVNTEAVYN